ncbi:alpha/beta hydrolase [Actinomadura sp. NAK00032]|uniref:alpha/beta fold hydrolase n=1 Tax=Actinomadura sp. NAK00032 TaxID=2742128 RepID=UPI0015918109|nr:alpha/beta hydrolase [Actinomadura sp. NAK00032]QKW33182.1 alpha/beta hydrolase [Actinomadura sp. NAK00032]
MASDEEPGRYRPADPAVTREGAAVREPSGDSLPVDAGGLRLRVLRYGGGGAPPLLVLPGITTTAHAAEFIALALTDRYTVHVPDLRGRGRSGRARAGHYTLGHHVDDVAAIVASLELDAPTLLGHSFGARIAAAYAVRHPGRHGRIVLVDPPLSGPGRRPYPTTREDFLAQLGEARRGTRPAELIQARYPRWPRREVAIRARELPTCDPAAVLETLEGFHRDDFHDLWRRLPPPAVLVRGEASPVVTAADAAELARANPALPVISVPDAGHMVPWDNPDGFWAALRDHL